MVWFGVFAICTALVNLYRGEREVAFIWGFVAAFLLTLWSRQ